MPQAVARHWLAQQSGRPFDPDSLPARCRDLITFARHHAVEVDAGILQGLAGPVIVTACTSQQHGLCVVSTACAATLETSLEHSLAESLVTALTRVSMPMRQQSIDKAF